MKTTTDLGAVTTETVAVAAAGPTRRERTARFAQRNGALLVLIGLCLGSISSLLAVILVNYGVMFALALSGEATRTLPVAIFNFLGMWNQYLLPLVLNTERDNYVLAQGLVNLQAQQGYKVDWGGMFASVVITVIPVLIVYVVFQRQLQGGVGPSTDK